MTIEEKRDKLERKCTETSACKDCPLYMAIPREEDCHSDDATIERNYNIMFGDKCGTAEEAKDNVNHPSHYETGKFECIDVMLETQGVEAVKSFCICNAFKYLYRHKNKNGVEDVKKAIWYLNKFIELE